ncbi:MAG: hypothetical protein HYZ28_07765 [Myxococcales bacterium]|nr:hypothetical protein [Myxococcales bacterium]
MSGNAEAHLVDVDLLEESSVVKPAERWSESAVVYLNSYRFRNREHRFAVPLKIELSPGEEGIIAFAPAILVGGAGPDEGRAMTDLFNTALSLFEEFSRTGESRLHASAKQALRRLRLYFA